MEMIVMPYLSDNDWNGQTGKQGCLHGLFPTDARLDSLL